MNISLSKLQRMGSPLDEEFSYCEAIYGSTSIYEVGPQVAQPECSSDEHMIEVEPFDPFSDPHYYPPAQNERETPQTPPRRSPQRQMQPRTIMGMAHDFPRSPHEVPRKTVQPSDKTKNFLQAFQRIVLNYLREHHPSEEIDSEPAVEKLVEGVSREAFCDLLQVPAFRRTFRSMFRERYLYRELMQTRIAIERKREYQQRIWKFQHAFKTGRFDRVI